MCPGERCAAHAFQYNDFLVQFSFPFPFSLLYHVFSHWDVFLLSSYYCFYVLRAPKWWLFGVGDPWVGHWRKPGETLLPSGQLLTIPESPNFCILLITGNSPSLLFLDIIGQDSDSLIMGAHPISRVVPLVSIRLLQQKAAAWDGTPTCLLPFFFFAAAFYLRI